MSSENFTYRPANPEDLHGVSQVNKRVPFFNTAFSRVEHLQTLLEWDPRAIQVATSDNQVKGAIIVCSSQKYLPHIQTVAILPEAQGRGIGKTLLQTTEESLRNRGQTAVTLIPSNPDNQADLEEWYRRQGYGPTADEKLWVKKL